jgi:O-antigen/teichoic acid export membrane protein
MASAVILLPFYILYLPTEVYGALSVCLAFSYLVQVIVTFSFDSSLYIHYHELKDTPSKLRAFISSSFFFMLGWGLVVGLVLSAFGHIIFMLILPNSAISFYPYGFIATGVGIFQAIFKVHGNLLQTREKPEPFLWSNVFTFLVIATATIAGLKLFPGTMVGPLGSRLLAGLLSCGWVLFRVFREFGFHAKSPWRLTSFSFNAYTFVYQLQQWSVNYLDRFLILFFMPLSAVGIYDFAVKCLVPIELLLNGLNAAINPKVIKLINVQKRSSLEINRYFYGLVSMIMLIICLSIIFIPPVIDIFNIKSGYAKSLQYIPYLAAIYVLRSMRVYFVVPYMVLKKMRRLTILNFFIALLKAALMALLIVQWELFGVIISSLAVYAIEVVLLWYYLRKDYEMQFNVFKLMIAPVMLLLLIMLAEPFIGTVYPLQTHLGFGVFCVALLWFAYRNEIKMLDPFNMMK